MDVLEKVSEASSHVYEQEDKFMLGLDIEKDNFLQEIKSLRMGYEEAIKMNDYG